MSPETVVAEFADRVRDGARSSEPDELRRALAAELRKVARAHARDPVAWSAWADGVDVPGDAYEALLTGADRRSAGQFQTPSWAADLMGAWLLQEPCERLLDPGVGAGRLLYRAVQCGDPPPKRLLGLDVDPVSLEMARVNLLVRGIDNVRLRQGNFLLENFRERPDALTCNPPYSRHHSIPAEEKEAIHAGFEERLGLRLSRLAGLHVLFLVRALEVIKDSGRLAFITPAEWLDVNYGRAIKEFVLDRAHVEALVIWGHDDLFFDGALTTTAITLLRAGAGGLGPTRVIRLPRRPPEVEEVLAAVAGEKTKLRAKTLDLAADPKWSRPARRRSPRGTPLSDLARVRRGVATGCNRFFVVSEAARRKRQLDLAYLRPCITTPRLVSGDALMPADLSRLPDEVPRWVLDYREPDGERLDDALGRYLRRGKRVYKAQSGYLASSRKPWYALERREASPILFTYMNRQRPRFVRNRAGAVPLNTFLIVEPLEVDEDELWQALNGEHVMRQFVAARRNYGGGLWKVEPRELGDIRIRLA